MNNEFLAVREMFRAYLNQDFDLEFGSADEAVIAFSNHSSDLEKEYVLAELNFMLDSCEDDNRLRDFILNDLGCYYFYPAEWGSGAAWLRHICLLLKGKGGS
ncbi:hypothetical protein BJP27_14925 [Pseudomonas oryzihabitans]|nr:hypothetical protein BJP27_14925 [Pseudomonas psychrotolerans]